jgi:hypothetical protein
MVYDGYETDVPLAENIVFLRFQYFVDPWPKRPAAGNSALASCVYDAAIPPTPLLADLGGPALGPPMPGSSPTDLLQAAIRIDSTATCCAFAGSASPSARRSPIARCVGRVPTSSRPASRQAVLASCLTSRSRPSSLRNLQATK